MTLFSPRDVIAQLRDAHPRSRDVTTPRDCGYASRCAATLGTRLQLASLPARHRCRGPWHDRFPVLSAEVHLAVQVATYAPMQAFSQIVEANQVIGNFAQNGDACRVSFYVAEAYGEAPSLTTSSTLLRSTN